MYSLRLMYFLCDEENIGILKLGKYIALKCAEMSEDATSPKLNWLLIAFAFILPFIVFCVVKIIKRKDYKCDIDICNSIDLKKETKDRIKAIDEVYTNPSNVKRLFADKSIFHRKTYLLNFLHENKGRQEFWISLISVFLGIFLSAFINENLLGETA